MYFVKGGGTLFILIVNTDDTVSEISSSQWGDGLFDVAWSEADANLVATASGDGSLQLWNILQPHVSVQTFVTF